MTHQSNIDSLIEFVQLMDDMEASLAIVRPYVEQFSTLQKDGYSMSSMYANIQRNVTSMSDTVHGVLRRAVRDQAAQQREHEELDSHDQIGGHRVLIDDVWGGNDDEDNDAYMYGNDPEDCVPESDVVDGDDEDEHGNTLSVRQLTEENTKET